MNAFVAAGAGFLMAVLWFDLMFDVQTRKHRGDRLPADILTSISAYYRRVTTEAKPMNRLITTVMALTLIAAIVEIAQGGELRGVGVASLILAASAIGLAGRRTVPNAVRLGGGKDTVEMQSCLARAIYRDHIYCFAVMTLVLGLQLSARF